MKEYNARTSRKPGGKQSKPSQLLKDRFRIYFPTNRTVSESRGGRAVCGQGRDGWVVHGLIQTLHANIGRGYDMRAGKVVALARLSEGVGP